MPSSHRGAHAYMQCGALILPDHHGNLLSLNPGAMVLLDRRAPVEFRPLSPQSPGTTHCGALAPIARGISDSHSTEPRHSLIEDTESRLQHTSEHHRSPFTAELHPPSPSPIAEPRLDLIAGLILPDLQVKHDIKAQGIFVMERSCIMPP